MFEKVSTKYSSHSNNSLYDFCSFKQKWCSWKSGKFSLQCRPTGGDVPRQPLHSSAREGLSGNLGTHHTEVKGVHRHWNVANWWFQALPWTAACQTMYAGQSTQWLPLDTTALLCKGTILPLLPRHPSVSTEWTWHLCDDSLGLADPWEQLSNCRSRSHPGGAPLCVTEGISRIWVLRRWLSRVPGPRHKPRSWKNSTPSCICPQSAPKHTHTQPSPGLPSGLPRLRT